jgi:hypothetical protein
MIIYCWFSRWSIKDYVSLSHGNMDYIKLSTVISSLIPLEINMSEKLLLLLLWDTLLNNCSQRFEIRQRHLKAKFSGKCISGGSRSGEEGIAEVYLMHLCTVPLDLTSGSEFSTSVDQRANLPPEGLFVKYRHAQSFNTLRSKGRILRSIHRYP